MNEPHPPQQPGGQGPQQPNYGGPGGPGPQGQPPQQPQYGGPGPQGQPGQPPQQPQFGGPPPQTPPGGMPGAPMGGQPMPGAAPVKKPAKTKRLIGLGIALVVIVVVVVVGIIQSKSAASSANPGDCIKVNSAAAKDANVEKIDCNSAEAVFKVATKNDGTTAPCPNDSYTQYTESGGGSDFGLCLMLNAKQGDCFKLAESDGDKTERADCATPGMAKVTKVVTGQAVESACPQETGLALLYPQPAPGETICLVRT